MPKISTFRITLEYLVLIDHSRKGPATVVEIADAVMDEMDTQIMNAANDAAFDFIPIKRVGMNVLREDTFTR